MSISILIPCFNEEKRIETALNRLVDFAGKNHDYEIVVEEDGSSDLTPVIIDGFAAKCPFVRSVHGGGARLGKGGGLKLAALNSTGKIIVTTDADLAVPPEEFPKLVKAIENGYDIVIASRQHRDTELDKHAPFKRRLPSRIFNLFVNVLFGFAIRDTQSGTKAFRREIFFEVQPTISLDYAMDVEMLARAKKRNFRIKEIGVHYIHGEFSRFSVLKDGSRMIKDVARIWLGYITGRM